MVLILVYLLDQVLFVETRAFTRGKYHTPAKHHLHINDLCNVTLDIIKDVGSDKLSHLGSHLRFLSSPGANRARIRTTCAYIAVIMTFYVSDNAPHNNKYPGTAAVSLFQFHPDLDTHFLAIAINAAVRNTEGTEMLIKFEACMHLDRFV